MLRLQNHLYSLLLLLVLAACDSQPALKPLSGDAVILAFGDSLTYGTGAEGSESYPAHLQQLTGLSVINAGVPGELSGAGATRLPALLERHRPALVILCHGGNDILRRHNLQRTRGHLQQMIDQSRHHGAQVLLVAVPQFGVFLSAAPFYQTLAEANQIPVETEALSDILSDNRLKADQIHPNASGYRHLAEDIVALLRDSGALQ